MTGFMSFILLMIMRLCSRVNGAESSRRLVMMYIEILHDRASGAFGGRSVMVF